MDLPAGRSKAILEASPTEVRHVLHGEEPVNIIGHSVFQDWNLHNQPRLRMCHRPQVPKNGHWSGQMLEDMEQGEDSKGFGTAEAFEVPENKLDPLPSERLAASFNGWFVYIHTDLFQALRQLCEETTVVTSPIKETAAGTEQAPACQPLNLLKRAAHGRPIRTTRFGKKNAKAIFRIAGVKIQPEAVGHLTL